jgi:glycosyltransferase involved in cell wall biosynthesis
VVDDGVTGLLVPVRSPARLAAAIRVLGEDDERRAAMGAAAVSRARASFDEARIVEAVLDAYRRGAARRRWSWRVRITSSPVRTAAD